MKIIIFQRVLPKYRYELIKELSLHEAIKSICIVSTYGELSGAQKSYDEAKSTEKLTINFVSSFNFSYKGSLRTTFLPFYPKAYLELLKYDIVLLEGTTNIINNIFIIPIARFFGKKIIWWDAGYSESQRSVSRKIKDMVLSILIKSTHQQMAYSSDAQKYMLSYMGAKNVFLNTNTIATHYFEARKQLFEKAISIKSNSLPLRLLYVGAIEKRKNVLELIQMCNRLKAKGISLFLDIVGNGKDKDEIIYQSKTFSFVIFHEASYDYETLEHYYMSSHFFILPGEGGLGVIQAMQFGLPVITVKADGTEKDYIDNGQNGHICQSIHEIEKTLEEYNSNFSNYEKLAKNVLEKASQIGSKRWIHQFIQKVTTL